MRCGTPAALPEGWACAPEGRLWILKEPRKPALPHRESEAGMQRRACARGAGRRGWAVRGAGGGVGGSEGKRFLVPAERGESGSAPRRREELSVCSALLPSSPPLLPPPPSPSREVLAAGAAARGPRAGAAGAWAAAGSEPLSLSSSLPGFVTAPAGSGTERQPYRAKDSPQVHGPGRGRRTGPCPTRARKASRTSR